MHNIGPQHKKVYDPAQLQRVGKIWKLCMWWADTEQPTKALISLPECNVCNKVSIFMCNRFVSSNYGTKRLGAMAIRFVDNSLKLCPSP